MEVIDTKECPECGYPVEGPHVIFEDADSDKKGIKCKSCKQIFVVKLSYIHVNKKERVVN